MGVLSTLVEEPHATNSSENRDAKRVFFIGVRELMMKI